MKDTRLKPEKTENRSEPEAAPSDEKYKRVLKIQRISAIVICSAILIAFIICYIKFGAKMKELFSDKESLRNFLSRYEGYDEAVFVLLRTFQTVIKIIPAAPLEIGSGYLWGTWEGFGLCMLGTLLGSIIILLLTRIFGQKVVELFIPMDKVYSLRVFNEPGRFYAVVFLVYLIPSTPKDLLTYVAGITKIDLKKFMLISMIARIPSLLASTWCGSEIGEQNFKLAIIILVIITVMGIIGSLVYKKYQDNADAKKGIESEGTQN